jgi:tetratricopeptide (TPR) repeat protein
VVAPASASPAPPQPAPSAVNQNATTIRTVPAAPPPAPPAPSPVQQPQPVSAAHADTVAEKATAPPPPAARVKSVKAEVRRSDNSVRIFFPFTAPTPAAVFRRADVMWLVFDSDAAINVDALRAQPSGLIRGANVSQADGQVIRLKLDRPRLGSMAMDGTGWAVTIGDSVADPVKPIALTRTMVGPSRANVIIPFDDGRRLHRIIDPDVGDTLFVVSALEPVRGVLKPQDFVELRALATTHGIAVQPFADDVIMQVAPERIVIGRPEGLTLSAHAAALNHKGNDAPALFNVEHWRRDREGDFFSHQSRLINAAVVAPPEQQSAAHVDLARFYLAREMFFEAKGALDLALSTEHPKGDDAGLHVLRALAKLMIGRTKDALKDLAHPSVGQQHDAPLWRALANAQEGKWAEARTGFKSSLMSIGMLPIELQRVVLLTSLRAAIEVDDIDGAASQLNDFETIGSSPDQLATISLLRGRIAEKLGRTGDALAAYQAAVASNDRHAATQARLRQAMLRMSTDELKRSDAIAELETISVIWRGDQTEIEALQMLARLYTDEGRLRDAFGVMRSALLAHAKSEVTRSIQDEAAATFEALFLSGKGEALPAIDALSLFYDFRDLTPMGRRGDEMIRRLADRLVTVDLLDQASELLQHQVDKRLQGAARAQVATRLAMIYLMNNKPDRALVALRATHVAGFSDTLRNRRLLLESRALSELGRPDVALEIIANIAGREADRLHADILWKARRWRPAAEQIERALGDRWRDWQPLNGSERNDVLRAGIGYALGEDAIGLGRLRERYAAKMVDGPDRRAFDIVTSPAGLKSAEFSAIATNVGSVDTLERFLQDLKAGFSDLAGRPELQHGAAPPPAPAPAAPTTGQAPPAPPASPI